MKKPYTNNTKEVQHIGSVTVMPGKTREVEEMHIQAHLGASESDEGTSKTPELSVVEQIRADSIPKILHKLIELSSETHDALDLAEKASAQPRVGVINAITEERLRRAADTSKEDLENFIATLDGMGKEELIALGSQFTGDPEKTAHLDAVNEALAKLEAENGDGIDSFILSLAEMSDVELSENQELYTDEADSVAYLDAVKAEIAKRAAN